MVVVRKLQHLMHITFISGEHDLYFDWTSPEEFESRLKAVHEALVGTGATYRVHTQTEHSPWAKPSPWPPPISEAPEENPAFVKRKEPPGLERIE